ncbi:hypothetical protein GCM10018790_81070 [Kitasatospora xanthocidica]|nr:hypothetical protein GCM10018790_81070 [Kitasatospora xanthocidica]
MGARGGGEELESKRLSRAVPPDHRLRHQITLKSRRDVKMGNQYTSQECFLAAGQSGSFGFSLAVYPGPYFALAMPNTTRPGKHTLWTEWHGVSRGVGSEEIPVIRDTYWLRVQNEQPDQSETFFIYAWIP